MTDKKGTLSYHLALDGKIDIQKISYPDQLNLDHAAADLSLSAEVLSSMYEDWPNGLFSRHFKANDPYEIEQHLLDMKKAVSEGYSYLFLTNDKINWLAELRFSHNKTSYGKNKSKLNNCYIDRFMVKPAYQQRRIGSSLLHAALTEKSVNQTGYLTIDILKKSYIKDWLHKLGLIETPDYLPLLFIDQKSFGKLFALEKTRLTSIDRISASALAGLIENKGVYPIS